MCDCNVNSAATGTQFLIGCLSSWSPVYQDAPDGLRPGSTFNLTFRLKAFPAYEPFATGQYGQALDTGIGETL